MRYCLIFFMVTWGNPLFPQAEIITTDIDNFWRAYDLLAEARSNADSIKVFEQEYIAKASKDNQQFIKLRDFTAGEIVKVIRRYPGYLTSIRENTLKIEHQKAEIEKYLLMLQDILPGFKPPRICFAFGCLRTGGTVSKGQILVGTEMVAADSSAIISELSPWLRSTINKTGNVVPVVVHEAVHSWQKNKYTRDLASTAMKEGFADFVTRSLLKLDSNPFLHEYGAQHECGLWQKFKADVNKGIADYSDWVYGGSVDENQPADLGYFVGMKIVEAYYASSPDKAKAIKLLSDCKNYPAIYSQNLYTGSCR
ncbi:MAG: DUF2268 domain-containing putative Zn-dependent protease [Bacteroidia bacterium]